MTRSSTFASLEATLGKLRKEEESPWGRIRGLGHQWLTLLERNLFLQNDENRWKTPGHLAALRSEPCIDLRALLLFSLLVHLLIFFLLSRMPFSSGHSDRTEPVLVHLLDPGGPAQEGKERPKKAAGKIAPRQRGTPAPPAVTEQKPLTPAPRPETLLPTPKVLAEAPGEKMVGLSGGPIEKLVQLPTRQPAGGQASSATKLDPLPAAPGGEGTSLPESLRRGEDPRRIAPGGTGKASALSGPDWDWYRKMIETRVKAVWQYPDGLSGVQRVRVAFVLDRAGKLARVRVVESTDPRIDGTALQAMKRASPFPPIPEGLKHIAGDEIGIWFTIQLGVQGAP